MKAVVLLSGGMDSTTALALAREGFEREVTALSIFYGQRHEIELGHARRIGDHYNVEHVVHEVPIPKGASLLMHHEAPMVHKSYAEIEGVSPTFVPFRNGILLSHAAAYAVDTGASEVWFGAHADDAAGWAYPDCTPEFVGAMAAAIYIGSYHMVRLITPFVHMTKSDIVMSGVGLGVPYELTRSCYTDNPLHCGVCPTCISRKEAFRDAGMTDPTEYANEL